MASNNRARAPNGAGSITGTKETGYRGSIRLVDPMTGQHVRKSVRGRTRQQVADKLNDLRRAASAGSLPGKTTVGEYLTEWLAHNRDRVRPSTWRQREQYLRVHVIPALGAIRLSDLAPRHVEAMTSGMLRKGLSPRSAAHARAILRAALSDAQRKGYIARNVAALADAPKIPSRAMTPGRDYLDTSQLRQLIAAAEDPRFGVGPLVIAAATTGLRQGELLGLSWGDVDVDAARLTVRRALARAKGGGWELAQTKTKQSNRTITIPASGLRALREERRRQDARREAAGSAWQNVDDLVFTNDIGQTLRGYNVNEAFHGLLRAAGLPSVPFHALRHTAATAMLTAKVPLETVRAILGHSTITLTANTYAAVVPEVKRDAADALETLLAED